MAYLSSRDVVSGQEAMAFIKINGQIRELFYAKNLKALVKKQKILIKTLGKRGYQSKAAGYSGSGVMEIYSVTSLFKNLMFDYMKKGQDVYFDIQVTNDDPTSNIGKQTVLLKNCNIDTVTMASFDVNQETLQESLNFTFEEVDILERYNI